MKTPFSEYKPNNKLEVRDNLNVCLFKLLIETELGFDFNLVEKFGVDHYRVTIKRKAEDGKD